MAVGGFGAVLAGLGEAFQKAQQDKQRQQQLQLQQQEFQLRQKAAQQQNDAAGLAFPSLLGGDLSGLANVGGGAPAPSAGPAPSPGMATGGALFSGSVGGNDLDLVSKYESRNRPYVGTGGTDLKPYIDSGNVDPAGFPNWPGIDTPKGRSTAAGLYQITKTNWDKEAPKAGVSDFSPGSQRKVAETLKADAGGLSPWVPYNRNLREALGSHEVPAPVHQEMDQTAQKVASSIPPMAQGRMSLQALAQQIEKANPGADPTVKMMALERIHKLLAPSEQQQFETLMLNHREEFQAGLQTQREAAQDARQDKSLAAIAGRQEAGAETKGYTLLNNPGQPPMWVKPGSPSIPVSGAEVGAGKMGAVAGPAPAQSEVQYWSTVLKNGGALPPGLARTKEGVSLIRAVMKDMSQAGDPNEFIANHATVTADSRSLANMTKMTDAAESFERTANANLDNALRLSKGAVPTDLGPFFNRWIENGQTTFGNEQVPPYLAAVLTAANEYAKIMNGSTGSQGSTVDSRREAAELLSPYLSSGQIGEVAKVLKQDMANRKRELEGQVADIKGRLKSGPANSAPGGQKPAAQAPVPVPPDHKSDPDGTKYQGSDGKVYVKKGDQMVPDGGP